MPKKQIKNHLIINWKDGSTRTRKSKPNASDLGTHELSTALTLDVVIPEVDIDELHATVEVPKPRVEQSALDDATAEDAPDWIDVADEQVADFLDAFDTWGEWRERRERYILAVLEDAPAQPPIEDVRRYLTNEVREAIRARDDD